MEVYDWVRKEVPHNVYIARPVAGSDDNTWYWNYESPWHRRAGSSITLGLKLVGRTGFNGKLFVKMSTQQVEKAVRLPVVVLG